MTNEEMKKNIMALNYGDKAIINGFEVEYTRYGIVLRRDGKWLKDFQRFDSVVDFLESASAEEELKKRELKNLFFEENKARIENGVIVHQVWIDRLGGDSIRDGVEGSRVEWQPMTRDEVDSWANKHGTTFEALFS